MGTTYRSIANRWDSEDIGSSDVGGRRSSSVAAEEIFDDPSIVDELNEANASLIRRIVAPPTASDPVRLPPVDAFDFDEACQAKDLANKLGPPVRDTKPRRFGWLFPATKKQQDDDWSGPYSTAPRGIRRGFFWGFCASLAIVSVAPLFLGLFRPLDGPLPRSIDNSGQGISTEVRTPDTIGAASIQPEQGAAETQQPVMIPSRPAAAAVIGPTTTAFATPLVPPVALEDRGEQIDPVASDSTPSSAGLETSIDSTADSEPAVATAEAAADAEPIVAETPTIPAETQDAPPAEVAEVETPTIPVETQETRSGEVAEIETPAETEIPAEPEQTELAHNAVAPSTEGLETTDDTNNVDPLDAVQFDAGAHSLSEAEIDRMLARGADLLRIGDISSARLVFFHVASAGDPRGAKAVGMTYDPDVFAQLPVMGLSPDVEQAKLWYERAGEASYTIDFTAPQGSSVTSAREPEEDDSRQWNAACAQKYRSFDPSTGQYTALSGAKRRCQLP